MRTRVAMVLRITCLILLGSGVLISTSVQGQAKNPTEAGVEKTIFGTLSDGTVVDMFTLKNSSGAIAKVVTYAATLTELCVPGRTGKAPDGGRGFDPPKGSAGGHPLFGAT